MGNFEVETSQKSSDTLISCYHLVILMQNMMSASIGYIGFKANVKAKSRFLSMGSLGDLNNTEDRLTAGQF